MSSRRRCFSVSALLALPLLGAALFVSCRSGPRPSLPRTVVLVSIDTLRTDHLGCYGYPRPTSPNLDAFASGALVFEDVTSPSPWTLPAHASLLTGVYPSRHGMKGPDVYLPPAIPTLAETLARHGFMTAAVVNSHRLSEHYGLDRGFRKFLYVRENAGQREPGTAITEKAVRWLQNHADKRLFLFVHYYDVHSDYASRPEFERLFRGSYRGPADGTTRQLQAFREGRVRFNAQDAAHLVDLYDAGIRQLDEELKRLLGAIERQASGRALVFVLSDHGEEFLERGGVLHGRTQFQELVRVPLIVRGPGLPAGRRIKTPVSLLDVFPTLLRLVGVTPPPGLDGEDLTPLWSGASRPGLQDRVLFGEADQGNAEVDITRAVRRGRHKLHYDRLTRASRLFDLEVDPWERDDVAARETEVVARLSERLARFLLIPAPVVRPVPLSPEEAERLRSLGYAQ